MSVTIRLSDFVPKDAKVAFIHSSIAIFEDAKTQPKIEHRMTVYENHDAFWRHVTYMAELGGGLVCSPIPSTVIIYSRGLGGIFPNKIEVFARTTMVEEAS